MIQKSYISEEDIINKFKKISKDIVWLIDGNSGIILNKLSTNNYLIIFSEKWKYKSFQKIYKYILIDIGNMIFKIELNKIKSGMIELLEYKTLEETN
jgi:hypothetical protein